MSPNGMNEEERRELIARQHRALYGNDSSLYMNPDNSPSRPISQDARVLAAASGPHGASPLNFDSFGMPSGSSTEGGVSMPPQSGVKPEPRENNTTSPAPKSNNFAMYESQQAPSQNAGSTSPSNSPAPQNQKISSSSGVAPIGTRPVPGTAPGKRNTPPQPSPLGYGQAGERMQQSGTQERSQSASSNPTTGEKTVGFGWNGNSGPWGQNKMQASVWG